MKSSIFLFGFHGELGDLIYEKLESSFGVCHWISTNSLADNFWSYVRVERRLSSQAKTRRAVQEYDCFYNENFNRYLLLVQRRGEHWRDFFEVRNEFSILYYKFSNLLDEKEPTIIIFANLPHEGADYILYSLAKYREIKTLLFYQSLHPNKFFAITNIEDFGKFTTVNRSDRSVKVIYKEPDLYYMKEINAKIQAEKSGWHRHLLYKALSYKNKTIKIMDSMKNKRNKRIYSKSIVRQLSLKKNDIFYNRSIKINHVSSKILDKVLAEKRVVYIPLHLQPELTTSALGGIYEDQLTMIEKISSELEEGYTIIVKDNPKQNSFQRKELFFRRLLSYSNVKIANYDTSSELLIDESILTATISGTAGWEALQKGKKSLVFGQAWYQSLPGCYHYNEVSVQEALRLPNPDIKQVKDAYELLISKCIDGIVDDSYSVLVDSYNVIDNATTVFNSIESILNSEEVTW